MAPVAPPESKSSTSPRVGRGQLAADWGQKLPVPPSRRKSGDRVARLRLGLYVFLGGLAVLAVIGAAGFLLR